MTHVQRHSRLVLRCSALGLFAALAAIAQAQRAGANESGASFYLIEANADVKGAVSCQANDDRGSMRAESKKVGASSAHVVVVTNGSSSRVNGRVSCGSDCGESGCLWKWRRTQTKVVPKSATNVRSCLSREAFSAHGCEVWTPARYYRSQAVVFRWLDPLGGLFERVNMNAAVRNEIVAGKGTQIALRTQALGVSSAAMGSAKSAEAAKPPE